MIEIYRSVYGGDHYLLATAMSNLGSVMVETGEHARAERLYRDAVAMFTRVQSPTHLNVGIGRLKLGRALLRQRRYIEAEEQSRAGYDIVRAQANPSIPFLTAARTDLIAEYEALGKPDRAAAIRAELQSASNSPRELRFLHEIFTTASAELQDTVAPARHPEPQMAADERR